MMGDLLPLGRMLLLGSYRKDPRLVERLDVYLQTTG